MRNEKMHEDERDVSRVDEQPLTGSGELPQLPTEDASSTAPERRPRLMVRGEAGMLLATVMAAASFGPGEQLPRVPTLSNTPTWKPTRSRGNRLGNHHNAPPRAQGAREMQRRLKQAQAIAKQRERV